MAGGTTGVRIAGALLVGVLAVIAVLLFAGIYLAFGNDHVGALLTVGVIALVFALGSYFARALTADPMAPRAASWGFAALGFTVLIGTTLFAPDWSTGSRLLGLILELVALAVAIFGVWWMSRNVAADAHREEARQAWSSRPPPSALNYTTAQNPASTPAVAPGPGDKP